MTAAPGLPPADTALIGHVQANEGFLAPALPVADGALIGSLSKGATTGHLVLRQPPAELPPADPGLIGIEYRGLEQPPFKKGE